MSEDPSWLTDEGTTAARNSFAKAVVGNKQVQAAATTAATDWATSQVTGNASSPAAASATPDVENQQPQVLDDKTRSTFNNLHIMLRLLYMSTAAFLGVAAGLSLVGQTNFGLIFFAFYVFFFALLICCFELGLQAGAKYIASNFGFMFTLVGRWVFMLFVGFMSFSFGSIGIAAMSWLYFVGLIHAAILIKYPQYGRYVRDKMFYAK